MVLFVPQECTRNYTGRNTLNTNGLERSVVFEGSGVFDFCDIAIRCTWVLVVESTQPVGWPVGGTSFLETSSGKFSTFNARGADIWHGVCIT